MEMVMPNTYSVLENEEMMYLDGGWSWDRAVQNAQGLFAKSAAFRIAMNGRWKYAWQMTKLAVQQGWAWLCATVSRVGLIVGGVIGGIIAGTAIVGMGFAMGEWKMFY